MEKYHHVYKITNMLNGKIYIGVHYGTIDDGYMGSGKYLNHAFDKYGYENFTKELIKRCSTKEESYEHETSLVTKEFISRKDTYNIKLGGHGGWEHTNRSDLETRRKIGNSVRGDKNGMYGKRHSIEARAKMGDASRGSKRSEATKQQMSKSQLGRVHSEDTKRKMSDSRKRYYQTHTSHQKGKSLSDAHKSSISLALKGRKFTAEHREKLSISWRTRVISDTTKQRMSEAQLGQIFINDGVKSKRVPSTNVDEWLENGWVRGRLPHKNKRRTKLKES